jgi:hypothetical protein
MEPSTTFLPSSSMSTLQLLRRATIVITLNAYSHTLPGMGGETADAMGEALG